MNSIILAMALAIVPGPDIEHKKQDLTILVDTTSKIEEVKRRSIIGSKEPFLFQEILPEYWFYLHQNYNIIIKEWDREEIRETEFPVFKVGKNGPWMNFVESEIKLESGESLKITAFNSSGSFIQTLVFMLRWLEYPNQLLEWEQSENEIIESEMEVFSESHSWSWEKQKYVLLPKQSKLRYLKYQRPFPPYIPLCIEKELEILQKTWKSYLDKDKAKEELVDENSFKIMVLESLMYYLNHPWSLKIKDNSYNIRDMTFFPKRMEYPEED